jgi:hypothetical protein
MTIRTVKGTISNLVVSGGSEITYIGNTSFDSSTAFSYRAFRVNPGSTGDIIVKIVQSTGVNSFEIFQEDNYTAGNAPTGYRKFANIAKDGKSKGVVAVTVTNAAKDYIVLLELDSAGSEVSYVGEVDVP